MMMKITMRNHGRTGLRLLMIPGILLLLFLVSPLVYFFFQLSWSEVPGQLFNSTALNSLLVSLLASTLAICVTGILGIPLSYLLARKEFPGRGFVTLLIYLPLVFPPVISGILLLLLYGPYGLIGTPFANAGLELDTSFTGVVLSHIFVAAPFVVIAARSAFEAVDPALEQVAATLGKSSWSIFWRVNLPVAGAGIVAGLLLGWLRALGEFGATMIMAYHPYTLPVYIYVQLSGPGVPATLPLALYALAVSVIGVGLVLWLQHTNSRQRVL
jgi:ABC-type sulfate transport system permease component